jgi:hypothetical protein
MRTEDEAPRDRRYFDLSEGRYVSLARIRSFLRRGESIRVVALEGRTTSLPDRVIYTADVDANAGASTTNIVTIRRCAPRD